MGLIENDPRDMAYAALYVAVKWFEEISSDAAIKIVLGQSNRKAGQKLTPETFQQIRKIIDSPNFHNINSVVRKFRVNKYEIYAALAGEKNANEEVIVMSKVEAEVKKLKGIAEGCTAVDCKKCILNNIMVGELTLCEMLIDFELDGQGKLVMLENSRMQKNAGKCIDIKLEGETKFRGFQVYNNVLNELQKFVDKHREEKVKDIVSKALAEYLKRHG